MAVAIDAISLQDVRREWEDGSILVNGGVRNPVGEQRDGAFGFEDIPQSQRSLAMLAKDVVIKPGFKDIPAIQLTNHFGIKKGCHDG